jgi:hypothetical protein
MPMTRENEEFLNVQKDDVAKMTSAMNDALFELMPDDAEAIAKKRKITRWDSKHGRYVRGTVSELQDNKHIRNESGKLIKGKSVEKRGELYAKWRKSHKLNEREMGEETTEKVDYRGK